MASSTRRTPRITMTSHRPPPGSRAAPSRCGMTLIEIMIVITIFAMIAGGAVTVLAVGLLLDATVDTTYHKDEELRRVPDALKRLLGRLQKVLELELGNGRTLAQADAEEVLRQIQECGYYLQMPPQSDSAPPDA